MLSISVIVRPAPAQSEVKQKYHKYNYMYSFSIISNLPKKESPTPPRDASIPLTCQRLSNHRQNALPQLFRADFCYVPFRLFQFYWAGSDGQNVAFLVDDQASQSGRAYVD